MTNKKDFINKGDLMSAATSAKNPFISEPPTGSTEPEEPIKRYDTETAHPAEDRRPAASNDYYVTARRRAETKSKKLLLLMTPTLHAAIKDRASTEGISANELINQVLEDYMLQD